MAMGIKGWITLGGVVLTGISVLLGIKKREDEHDERIKYLIREVDGKEPKKEEPIPEPVPLEKIVDDITMSFRALGLDKEADAYEDASKAMNDMQNKCKEEICVSTAANEIANELANELGVSKENLVKKGESELNKVKGLTGDELMQQQEAWEKQREAKAEEKWQKAVRKAIDNKDYHKLENLFDQKYAGGPWHPSPASVFGEARKDNVITDEFYKEASEYFGRLWNYSGD